MMQWMSPTFILEFPNSSIPELFERISLQPS